jgi:hypothetical protein
MDETIDCSHDLAWARERRDWPGHDGIVMIDCVL